MKKLISLVLALCMLLTVGAAFAAVNEQTPDTSVTVGGLDAGDVVNFYKLIKWVPNEGWAWADGVEAAAAAASITLPTLKTITGYYDTTAKKLVDGQISVADGATLAQVAVKLTAVDTETVANGANTVTYAKPAYADGATDEEKALADVAYMGLYVALVTPATADNLYNPIFVAADYNPDASNTNSITVEEGKLSYQPAAMAKKEKLTLTKEVDGGDTDAKYDVNVGDTVNFTITSKVPAYSDVYQDPTYVITDTMESGLELQGTPTVTVASITLEAADYTVEPAADKLSFTVTMNESGLAKVAATGKAQEIVVKYAAKVISLEDATVTEKENEATVKFSNNPSDKTSYSLLEDKTRNYSFSIDANLLGYTGDSYETDELIKTGLDASGNLLTEKKNYRSGTTWTELSPLEGAIFGLYSDPQCTTFYTNTVFTTGKVTSDSTGRLKIEGLDAGTYYLKEISAPAGYIADNRTFTITITAEYTEIEGGTYTNNDGILVKYDAYKILKSYKVVVNDGEKDVTSSYDIANKGDVHHHVVDKATYQTITGQGDFAGDAVTPISNTQGTELPSTGGIGTTIFYVLGGLLVVGAAIILVARRKAHE